MKKLLSFTPLYESSTSNGETKNLHYLTSATGIFAIFVTQNGGGGTMYYTLKDHQGSLAATVHGNTVERLSYDPWGRRRNTTNFGYDNVSHTFDRGYTLHEHYDEFDLINMNGRLYDPILGRMLSPDIVVQDEQSSQAYNRYSYCFNNPLRFTDPSGYVVTIPPEFVDMFLYAKDVEVFHDMISGLGIKPSTVQYDTKEVAEGVQKTTVCWMIGEDSYNMVKYDYVFLRDYYQQYKNGCAATCFWALEHQWDPYTEYNETYFMGCDPNSFSNRLSVRELCELFVGTQIGDNYYPGISNTYHFYSEKEISDTDREGLSKECFDTFGGNKDGSSNDAVMYLFPSKSMNHAVNAVSSARLQINGKSTLNDYSVWIWDSSKINGGFKLFDPEKVKYRFIIAK